MIKVSIDGTSFDYHFYLKRKGYSNLYQINDAIEELDEDIARTKQRIFGLAVATPILKPEHTMSDMISEIQTTLDEEFECLKYDILSRYRLILLREVMENENIQMENENNQENIK